jgi:hypothetical protein
MSLLYLSVASFLVFADENPSCLLIAEFASYLLLTEAEYLDSPPGEIIPKGEFLV